MVMNNKKIILTTMVTTIIFNAMGIPTAILLMIKIVVVM